MITITKQNDGVLFTFQDSDKYLYGNGTIEVPFNTLSIIADESDMITLKKAASNDVFLSARYDTDLGYRSKDDAIDDLKGMLFAETGGGGSGSGVTPSEVQEMIDESISGKADTSDVTAVANDVSTLSGQVATKVATTDFNTYSAATDSRLAEDEEVTAAALNDLDERIGDPYQKVSGLTIETDEEEDFPFIRIEKEFEDGNSNYTYINDAALESTFENNADRSHYSSYVGQGSIGNGATDYPESGISSNREFQITTDGFNQMTENSDDNEGYSPYRSESEFNYGTGLEMHNTWTEPDQENVGEFIESSSRVTINSQQYPYIELEDVEGNVTRINTTGITINDGQTIASEDYVDAATSGKADTSAVTAAIDAATSGKVNTSAITTAITSGSTDAQVPSAKATFDAIQSGGGGGATYSAGTNISIDTGNTINCTLPMRVINNTNIDGGDKNSSMSRASSSISYGKGNNFARQLSYGAAFGQYNILKNNAECSVGYANNSNYYSSTFGNSGNTLFSVGNGGAGEQVRHNAFEVRQNGDIYFPDTDNTTYQNFNQKPMVRLQDMYGALGGLKFVQCTQAYYDALVSGGTVDSSTIYFITNVVS